MRAPSCGRAAESCKRHSRWPPLHASSVCRRSRDRFICPATRVPCLRARDARGWRTELHRSLSLPRPSRRPPPVSAAAAAFLSFGSLRRRGSCRCTCASRVSGLSSALLARSRNQMPLACQMTQRRQGTRKPTRVQSLNALSGVWDAQKSLFSLASPLRLLVATSRFLQQRQWLHPLRLPRCWCASSVRPRSLHRWWIHRSRANTADAPSHSSHPSTSHALRR